MLSRESDRFVCGVSKETDVSTSPPCVRVQLELNCGVADENTAATRPVADAVATGVRMTDTGANGAAVFLVAIMP